MVSKYKKQLLPGIGFVRSLITGLFLLSSLSGFALFTNVVPPAPVTAATVYYCQDEAASPLVATATGANKLVWYLSPDGAPSNTAFTPNTNIAGTTSYYVSQSDDVSESPMVKIDVIVMQTPTPGAITSTISVVCRGAGLTQLSNTIGTGAPGSVISYRWEQSVDDGNSWSVVPNATDRTYFPMNMQKTTSFRRITVAILGGKSCESVPTIPLILTVRDCTVISNPMLRSKAKSN